jgi:hypothetical protein
MFSLAPLLDATSIAFAEIINVVITTSLDRNEFWARVGLRIALCIPWDDLDVALLVGLQTKTGRLLGGRNPG